MKLGVNFLLSFYHLVSPLEMRKILLVSSSWEVDRFLLFRPDQFFVFVLWPHQILSEPSEALHVIDFKGFMQEINNMTTIYSLY